MTREQFDKLYANKAVWCKTEELAEAFLKLAHSVGYVWRSGSSLLNNNTQWGIWGQETVYFIDNVITYSNCYLAKGLSYSIVEFKGQPQEPQTPRVFDADALAIELSAIHKHLSLIDEPISGLIDVVKVEDLPKVKELREHYEAMAKIIDELKGE